MKRESTPRSPNDHYLKAFISFELKERLRVLAERYDQSQSDIIRTLIKLGLPILEGIMQAEEELLDEHRLVIRKLVSANYLDEV